MVHVKNIPRQERVQMTIPKNDKKTGKSNNEVDSSKTMDKYAVEETRSTKQASMSAECPWCGATLLKHGSVLLCPKHGSEPFESLDD